MIYCLRRTTVYYVLTAVEICEFVKYTDIQNRVKNSVQSSVKEICSFESILHKS